MFPGVSTDKIEEAMSNRRNNVLPPLPRVTGTLMDLEGKFTIVFDQYILLPETIDQKYWDLIFEVYIISNSDDSIYQGFFFDNKRVLQKES
jgi:hypothetical protein